MIESLAETGIFQEMYWTFTLDLAFDRNIQFANFVFKRLRQAQEKRIAVAVDDMIKFRDRLNEHRSKQGDDSKVVDEDEKDERSWLKEKFPQASADLEFEARVGKVLKDIVLALRCDGGDDQEELKGELLMLGRPDDYEM